MISTEDFNSLTRISVNMIQEVSMQHKRYLYDQIDWQARLICIRGAKGTGKTTMLLQYIKEHYKDLSKVLYVSLDSFLFQRFTLYDVADYAYTHGIERLFVDEVHYHKHWSLYIKNIYDNFKSMKLVYTGSSILQLMTAEADLSRRQSVYDLQGFSFREYLVFKNRLQADAVSLTTLLAEHNDIALQIKSQVKPLEQFNEYLTRGYYPFALEGTKDYYKRIESVMNLIIFQDIPLVEDISFATLQKARTLLSIIAKQVPLQPNITTLCREVDATRDVLVRLLYLLEKAGLLLLLKKEKNNYKALSRPDKIYLNNTNQMYAMISNVNRGTLRETFFFNQLQAYHSVIMPQQGDFLVDDKYLFEVGGADKSFKQIKDLPDSYLAVDDVEFDFGNRIPLWLFGFLY